MDISTWIEHWGEPGILAAGGAVIGLIFGFFSQRSRFCLRAAVIEFWHDKFDDRLSIWLLTFAAATLGAQSLIQLGWLDVSQTRQLASRGSMSGALIGGFLFGAGMIMTRGCASRLLILSANGNLRALLCGLVFAVTAQASLSGALAPLRVWFSEIWTVEGGTSRNLLAAMGSGSAAGIWIALIWLAIAVYFSRRSKSITRFMAIAGAMTGLCVAAAWAFNYTISRNSFEVVPVQALTFSGPSAEWLMRVLSSGSSAVGFNFGMLPGVFAGSFISAALAGELKVEGFKDGYSMARYITGAVLMGFGAMLAGGCAVGAGVTGGSIFALTAWVALIGMWFGGGLMDRLLDNRKIGMKLPQAAQQPVAMAP
jgi:uncharacterized membrane protein YedE/YeeE